MRLVAVLVCLAIAGPVRSEIAPEALWDRWSSGQATIVALQGTLRSEGDASVVEDAVLRLGDAPGAPRLRVGSLRLEPAGEATTVTPSEEWRLEWPDGTTADVSAPLLAIRVEGEIEAPDYRIDTRDVAASAILTTPSATADVTMEASALEAQFVPASRGDMSADRLSLTVAPRGEGQGRIAATYEAFRATVESADGAAVRLTTDSDASSRALSAPVEGGGGDVTFGVDSGPGRSEFTARDTLIEGFQSARGVTLSASGDPVPLSGARLDVDALTLSVAAPARPTAETAPVTAELALAGVSPSEQIWQLIDPGADLPRDPGDLRLRLSGEMSWRTDEEPPLPEIERASIDTLRLSALGVEMVGQGGLQFRPPVAPGELAGPPVGAIAFSLTGVGALLDRLDDIGTLEPNLLFGARVLLGMLTVPGERDDALRSEITFASDGAVLVNGVAVTQLP